MTDFKSGHLAWINSTKSFTPKYAQDYRADISYFEIMKLTYNNSMCTQDMAKQFWAADKAWHKASYALSKAVDKEVEKLDPTPNGMWFVTIGFNHQTWSVKECCKVIEKILAMDWIISAKANFELFRENGEHPHCHFVIETKEPKSRILDKLLRPLYVKKVVLSKNFIDVKPMMKYHLDYINLNKVSEKQEYVNKDREWRIKEKIPDYEKNWNKTKD